MKWTDPDVRVLVRLTIAFLTLTGFYVVHRVELLDEGWYLYAGKLAWRGELPYRDFTYFQAPLLPYIYGASQKLLPPGLLSGRLVAAAFAAATWLLTLSVARRLGGGRAAIIAAFAFLSSIYLYSHFPIVLTYAPAACFLMAAVDASLRGQIFRTVVFAVIAAGIRISLAPAVPILAASVFLVSPRARADAMRLAAGLALGAALALLFLLPDPGLALYNLVGYHVAGRSLVERLHNAGASAAETLAATSMLLVPALVAPRLASDTRLVRTLTGVLVAVLLANLVPATAAPYYNSVLLPLLAVLAGVSLARVRPTFLVAALLALHALAQLEPAHRLHVVSRARSRSAWPFENRLSRLAEVGRDLRAVSTPTSRIFTLATYFAIDADRDVMPGLEMSIFSVEFFASREQCLRHHTVNPEMIRDWFRDGVPDVVLLTGWEVEAFGGRNGPVLAPLQKHYAIRKIYARVGQVDGKAFLLTRRRH